jgi:hypothetical protein
MKSRARACMGASVSFLEDVEAGFWREEEL